MTLTKHTIDYETAAKRPALAITPMRRVLGSIPVAAAAGENDYVEHQQCQLRDTVQVTALAELGRAHRKHQDSFDSIDGAISKRLAEKNRLHKACETRPIDDNRAAFYHSRRLLQRRLRLDAWTARTAEEIQGYVDRDEWKNFSAIKAVYGPPT
ncbi:hypothetical protein SprV_0200715600 [Sparganum proliferum]